MEEAKFRQQLEQRNRRTEKKHGEIDRGGWVVGWLGGLVVCWVDGWLAGWLVGWLAGWLVGWLAG